MSILFDAVMRAKSQNQQLGMPMSPQTTSSLTKHRPHWFKVVLLIIGIALVVLLAWLLSQPQRTTLKMKQKIAINQTNDNKPTQSLVPPQSTAKKPVQNKVQPAGKVALPIATISPQILAPIPIMETSPQVPKTKIATILPTRGKQQHNTRTIKPNNNQKNQLASLQQQVNAAALELGLKPQTPRDQKPSKKLVASIATALNEVEKNRALATPITDPKHKPIPTSPPDNLQRYGQLPTAIQKQIPEFNILAHVYTTTPNDRWLNVDGVQLQQGDMIQNKLKIIEIRPTDVVLEIAGAKFKVPAI